MAAACGGDDGDTAAPAPPPATKAPAAPADTVAPDEDAVELSQAGGRLAEVQGRGTVRCGVRDALPGFNFLTPEGDHEGFDSDFYRVIAAGVLGDADAVDFVDLATADRFTALQSGEIDVLVRNTTFTASRDSKEAANFVYTTLYDGQGVMVPASTGIGSLEELADANICVAQGATTELNLTDVMRSRNIPFNPVTFGESSEARVGYTAGQCEAFTSDKSGLAVFKFEIENGGGDEQFILPETISKEPLGPVVLDGDTEWAQVVQWAVMATIGAWEFGLDSGTIASATGTNPYGGRPYGALTAGSQACASTVGRCRHAEHKRVESRTASTAWTRPQGPARWLLVRRSPVSAGGRRSRRTRSDRRRAQIQDERRGD